MLWRTHIRLANEILYKLRISKSSPEAGSLREGIIAPDKWKDFPHHHGKEGEIEKHIVRAREFFLGDNLLKAYFHLGVALHYIQDSYTSLSTRSGHHSRWEEQMDDAYFADDLNRLVEDAFYNRPDRREEYLNRLEFLSGEIEGKEPTVKLAGMTGPGSFGRYHVWGKPYVDVNFALRASYLISKSVLAPKRCNKLQEKLKHIHKEYETMMKEAEISFARSILESVKKRDEWTGRRQKNGLLQTIKNGFLTVSSKRHEFDAKRKLGKYRQRGHLTEVLRKYEKIVKKIVAPHHNWYHYEVPELDLNVIENELLSVNEASEHIGVEDSQIRQLISNNVISIYQLDDEEFIKREDVNNRIA